MKAAIGPEEIGRFDARKMTRWCLRRQSGLGVVPDGTKAIDSVTGCQLRLDKAKASVVGECEPEIL